MCETFAGRVQRLDYKTLRYPGQFVEEEAHHSQCPG